MREEILNKNKLILFFLSYIISLISIINCQYDLQDYGVILDNKHRSRYYWGTYKPNLYFAMKNRRNTSQVFGLMWYGAGAENFESNKDLENRIRHDCRMDNGLKYRWEAHNGLDYGDQVIEDESLNLKLSTKFIKNNYNYTNQSWDAVIEGELLDDTQEGFFGSVSVLLYAALENNLIEEKAFLTINKENNIIEGQESGKKEFFMKFEIDEDSKLEEYSIQKYRKVYNETWRIKKYITEDLKNAEISLNNIREITRDEKKYTIRDLDWRYGKFSTRELKQPNIIVYQYVFKKPFRIFVRFNALGLDNSNVSSYKNKITENLQIKKNEFENKFNKIYNINFEKLKKQIDLNSKDEKLLTKMSQQALSNILGGIGHFYGAIKINLEDNLKPGNYHKGFRYAVEKKELFTGTPSRSFFPRGFLWDEGFHNIIISQWDVNISIDILNSWLSTMSATGWMAREQIRGLEAESKVPRQFLVQDKLFANPPTLIFAVNNIMNYYKNNFETENLKNMKSFLKKCSDKFSSWYEWFEIYQKSSDKKSYQWYGRTNQHNLASGFDDYPRGMNPNIYEKHLDLNSWVIELLKTLTNLSEIFDNELMQHFQTRVDKMTNELNKNFLDPQKGILNDYIGPQYKLFKSENYVDPVPPITWRGDGKCGQENLNTLGSPADCNPYSDMPCCSEFGWCGNSSNHCKCEKCKKSVKLEERKDLEKENIFNPHLGYVNLFPIIFGYLKKEDPAFRNALNLLANPLLLNSEYGIRSLSKSDLLYHEGEDYWRGNIWININFLTLKGLHKFYSDDEEARNVYNDLRIKVIKMIFMNWKENQMFYEQYSDVDGKGLKARPFNGWTSLVLNILTEKYEN